ncbi:unnamed protein product, partial [Amoebophrya sp. A25]
GSSSSSTASASTSPSIDLILFDTLELDIEAIWQAGPFFGQDLGFNLYLLGPTCDYQRLQISWEDVYRRGKVANKVYYGRADGMPYRKVIVQPTLQSRRDGTCLARALAALLWLHTKDWDAELKPGVLDRDWKFEAPDLRESSKSKTCGSGTGGGNIGSPNHRCSVLADDEPNYRLRTLFSTGERNAFGRRFYTLVQSIDAGPAVDPTAASPDAALTEQEDDQVSDARIVENEQLRRKRAQQLIRIRQLQSQGAQQFQLEATTTEHGTSFRPAPFCSKGVEAWRDIADPQERWDFLESTCFWFANYDYQVIKKSGYPAGEVLKQVVADSSSGTNGSAPEGIMASTATPARQIFTQQEHFSSTERIRKFRRRATGHITHEADPTFFEPLESCLRFLRVSKQVNSGSTAASTTLLKAVSSASRRNDLEEEQDNDEEEPSKKTKSEKQADRTGAPGSSSAPASSRTFLATSASASSTVQFRVCP